MARIPKLDAAGKFLAADVNAQIDARTKATMRADLPELAKELKIGGSSTGGVYYDKAGKAVPYVYVVSDTDPGKSKVIDGQTYEVWWVQTTPPDPMQSTPIGVTQNVANRSYTVPSDPVATYTVGGSLKSPGTYSIGTSAATTLTWTATAKSGYGFKAGAVTSGTLTYPVKTYASGDVLLSDNFNDRAEGSLIAGTMTNSYAGGEPVQWVASVIAPNGSIPTTPAPWQVKGGALVSPAGENTKATASLTLGSAHQRVAVEYIARPTAEATRPPTRIILRMTDGEIWLFGSQTQWRPKSGSAQSVHNITINVGDRVRFIYDGANSTWTNLTTGMAAPQPAAGTAQAAGIASMSGTFNSLQIESEPHHEGIDDLKVYIP